jgi:hypothetical protein
MNGYCRRREEFAGERLADCPALSLSKVLARIVLALNRVKRTKGRPVLPFGFYGLNTADLDPPGIQPLAFGREVC